MKISLALSANTVGITFFWGS